MQGYLDAGVPEQFGDLKLALHKTLVSGRHKHFRLRLLHTLPCFLKQWKGDAGEQWN